MQWILLWRHLFLRSTGHIGILLTDKRLKARKNAFIVYHLLICKQMKETLFILRSSLSINQNIFAVPLFAFYCFFIVLFSVVVTFYD